MKEKFVKKFMKVAKCLADDNDACGASRIAAVVVNPETSHIVSVGYNGAPQGVPHCSSGEYIVNHLFPLLDKGQQLQLLKKIPAFDDINDFFIDGNMIKYTKNNSGKYQFDCEMKYVSLVFDTVMKTQCPRRVLGCQSGENLHYCSPCIHAEVNAIINSDSSTKGCYMFCWCCVPCNNCAGTIINAGIKRVYCLKDTTQYQSGKDVYRFDLSRWMFKQAGVEVIELDRNTGDFE